MMTMYALVIVATVYQGGAHIDTSLRFRERSTCEEAAVAVMRSQPVMGGVKAVCVPHF